MAAPTFLKRADAVAHAREQGWAAFRTKPGPDDTWRVNYEPGENTGQDAADAYPYPEHVSHGEVAWVAGATGDEDPYRASVLVFTVPLDQVQATLPDVYLDEKLSRVWVRVHGGAAMLCEPHDAARWPVFTPRVAAGPGQGAAAAGTGDRAAAAPRAPRQPATPAVRSTAESPTRRVWALADAMPGATRQQVVAACVAEGINKNTAGTQYHHWTKRQQAQG